MRGRLLALLVASVAVAVLGLAGAAPAQAHAYLSSSNPADGASLSAPPDRLQLGFSEHVVLGATSLDLTDSQGTHYRPTGLRIESDSAEGDTEEPVTVVADLPRLRPDAYRLNWATLSRDDLHRTSGVIVFGIGRAVTAAGHSEPRPSGVESALRWMLFCTLALAFGGLLAARLLRRTGRDAGPAFRLTAGAALAATVVAGIMLAVQGHSAGLTTVLQGRYGLGWTGRELGLIALALLALRLDSAAGAPRRWSSTLLGLAVAAVALGSALVGHSSTGGSSYLLADALHVLATGTWVGCPVVLLIALRRAQPGALRRALTAFAAPAAALVAVVVVTGIYLISNVVVSVDAGLATLYGRTLLIKIGVFAVVAGLGLVNFRRLRGGPRAGFRPTVVAEGVVAVLVIGLAAVLTSSQPAREPEFVRAGAPASTGVASTAADLEQTLSIRPNRPGKNVVVLGIFDRRRPAPGQIVKVTIAVTDSSGASRTVVAQALPDNTWSGPLEIGTAGAASVHVAVDRAGLAPVGSDFAWTVDRSSNASRSRIVSQAPIRVALQRLSIGLALVLLLVAGMLGIRSRRQRADEPVSRPEPDPVLQNAGAG